MTWSRSTWLPWVELAHNREGQHASGRLRPLGRQRPNQSDRACVGVRGPPWRLRFVHQSPAPGYHATAWQYRGELPNAVELDGFPRSIIVKGTINGWPMSFGEARKRPTASEPARGLADTAPLLRPLYVRPRVCCGARQAGSAAEECGLPLTREICTASIPIMHSSD